MTFKKLCEMEPEEAAKEIEIADRIIANYGTYQALHYARVLAQCFRTVALNQEPFPTGSGMEALTEALHAYFCGCGWQTSHSKLPPSLEHRTTN